MIWQKQRFIIGMVLIGISFIVYLLNSLIERTTAAVWCNIYLKHVFGTCYLISLLFRFMALENLYLQNELPQTVRFGELFRTAETNSERTS